MVWAVSFVSRYMWEWISISTYIYLLMNDTWVPALHFPVLIIAMWYPLRTFKSPPPTEIPNCLMQFDEWETAFLSWSKLHLLMQRINLIVSLQIFLLDCYLILLIYLSIVLLKSSWLKLSNFTFCFLWDKNT